MNSRLPSFGSSLASSRQPSRILSNTQEALFSDPLCCWGPCLQRNAKLLEANACNATHSGAHRTVLFPPSLPLAPLSLPLSSSRFFSEEENHRKRSQPVEADRGDPLAGLGPAPLQVSQAPLAPPRAWVPGPDTRNCLCVAGESWQGLGVVGALRTFLLLLCPHGSGLGRQGDWTVEDLGSKWPSPSRARLVTLWSPRPTPTAAAPWGKGWALGAWRCRGASRKFGGSRI